MQPGREHSFPGWEGTEAAQTHAGVMGEERRRWEGAWGALQVKLEGSAGC